MVPSPGRTADRRGRRPEQILALLAALVVLLQLPGPGTCQKRFTAVSPSADAVSDARWVDTPGDADTILAARIEVPRVVRCSFVADVALPSRLDRVVTAGTTRAPPLA
jgi:hypothetical protein